MGLETCAGCFSKDAEILLLRMRINALEEEVIRLNRIIASGQAAAAGIVSYSARTMNGGGLPRGTWSLLKGRAEAAIEIDKVLSVGLSNLR